MARPKIHRDNAERIRACRLRKRSLALSHFLGTVLTGLYRERGFDVNNDTVLPWLPFAEVEKVAGVDIRNLLDFPFIQVDRSRTNDPRIRIAAVQRK